MKPQIQAELEQIRRAVQAHRAGNIDLFLEQQSREREMKKKLQNYEPYPKHLVFHEAGATTRERCLLGANQTGKTFPAAAETAMHLTGRYPEWWQGRRYDRPVAWLVASKNGKLTRDGAQAHLFGVPKFKLGMGMVPEECIISTPSGGSSLKDAFDFATVRHVSGGDSICYFRSYDQGEERNQALTLDGVWEDEEPPEAYHFEMMARTSVVQGLVYVTIVPRKGWSKIVQRFFGDKPAGTHLVHMTLDDAKHYTPEQREDLIASYPAHEREARAYGLPSKGSGVVYPVTDESIMCDPLPIPSFWRQIGGIDIGGAGEDGHPTAAVRLALDPEADIVYVTATYRVKGGPVYQHAATLKTWGEGRLPWAWPKDAYQHRESAGFKGAETVKGMYEGYGMTMLPEHSQFEDGGISVEVTCEQLLDRMLTGKFKVFRHLSDFFGEFGQYHRKNGIIVAENDDIMSAMHYAYRMLRFSEPMKQEVTNMKGYVKPEWV